MTAYLTDAKELTAIADAIREKTGLTDSLSYPLDFIRAVEEYAPPPDRIFGTALTGDVVWTGQTVRGNVSGSGVTSFYAPNAVDVPTAYSNGRALDFTDCKSLTAFRAPRLAALSGLNMLLRGCTALQTLDLKSMIWVPEHLVSGCTALKTVVFPNLNGIVYGSAFYMSGLEICDLGGPKIQLSRQSAFARCGSLHTLILRSPAAASLSNLNNFSNTPFDNGGTGGALYVPAALISAYQGAANWSTILGYPNNRILPIEGSVYETRYADGTEVPR